MILATPIFFPIMTKLGYDPLLVGILVALTICIAGDPARGHLRLRGQEHNEGADGRHLQWGLSVSYLARAGSDSLLCLPQIVLFLPNLLMG